MQTYIGTEADLYPIANSHLIINDWSAVVFR